MEIDHGHEVEKPASRRRGSEGMNELIFVVENAPEGGYTARALGASIITEADDLDTLREQVRDAVRCHFDEGQGPRVIRFDELITKVFPVTSSTEYED